MPRGSSEWFDQLKPYAVAVAAVGVAFVFKLLLDAQVAQGFSPFLLFSAPVMITAWFGGARPGLFSVVLAVLLASFFMLEPRNSFAIEGIGGYLRLAVFAGEGVLISMLAGALHDARTQAQSLQGEAEVAHEKTKRHVEELTQTRNELIASRLRFRGLIDANVIGVITVDSHQQVVAGNDAFLQIIGYDRGDIESGGLRLDELTPEDHVEADHAAADELENAGKSTAYEKELLHQQGRRVPVLTGAARLPGDDITIWFIVDLSEAKQTEWELQHAIREAERANQAKSVFLANISHELRTPMNAIIGMTELTLQEELPTEVRDNLEVARESAESLLRLLDDLLDFSKLEAGKFELDERPVRVGRIVEDSVRLLTLRAQEKGLTLRFELDDALPTWVAGDDTRLKQILTNLIGNAIKFTRKGEIVVAARLTEQDAEAATIEFQVLDTGIGIAPDVQQRVYAPFTQGDASPTRAYTGAGLGLAIVHELVGLMSGRIWMESEVGRGTSVFVSIPFALAEAPPRADRDRGDSSNGSDKACDVLVAEDTTANQKVIRAILKKQGHRVQIAKNGHEAFEWVRREHFDVILMDIQMPRMDGLEATRKIRKLQETSGVATDERIPIIAMTAHAMPGDRQRCLAAGMDDYIAKPIIASELLDLIQRHASRQSAQNGSGKKAEDFTGPASNAAVLNLAAARQRLGNDDLLLREMIELFLEDAPRLCRTVEEAARSGDLRELERAAHSLKGLSANFNGEAARKAAWKVEQAAHDGDLETASGLMPELCRELKRLVGPLGNHLEG